MVILNLLVKPFSIFGIDAAVQNRVGSESYGLYFTLLNISFLFNIIMDLGINNFTTKNIAQYPHIVTRYMGKLISFKLFLFLIYAVFTFSIGAFFGLNNKEFLVLVFLIINQFLIFLIAYFRSHFVGLLYFKTEAFISVLDRLLLIFFCGFLLLLSHDFKIEWFVWLQTFCYGLTALISLILIIKYIGLPKLSWNWTFSKAIVKKSIPFALLVLLMTIYTRSDVIILEKFHPQGNLEVGIYAQGFRLVDALFIFGMIFSNLLFPLFSKLFRDKENILPLLRTGGNLLIGGSILIVAFCYTNSEFVIDLIYKNNIQESIPSFQWLILSFIGMCFSLIFGTLLTAHGSLRILIIYSFFAIVLNLSLNFILTPTLGAEGSAIAAFSTQTFIALIQFFYCAKMFHFDFSVKYVNRYILYIGTIVIIFFLLNTYPIGEWTLITELLLGTLSLFVFKMINLKALKSEFMVGK